FTQILDILKSVLDFKGYRYLLLTGSTAVDERQGLVDEFNEDENIKVFLLSTKAGGMGINLTAASVVITYDQDFNPHNDLQASDRAYRIGQQRDVDVIRLITRGTIEEDILALAQTKLALDEAVAGDEEASKQTENEVKKSLIQRLRKQLEQQDQQQEQLGLVTGTGMKTKSEVAAAAGAVKEEGISDDNDDEEEQEEIEVKPKAAVVVGTPNERETATIRGGKGGKKERKSLLKRPRGFSNGMEEDVDVDVLSALPAALLAVAARDSSSVASSPVNGSGFSGTASPAGSGSVPPATQSPTPLPTPPEQQQGKRRGEEREGDDDEEEDVIMVEDD
ncbi:hypothetical protein FRC17_008581, partial [Serendipita sp. 399]